MATTGTAPGPLTGIRVLDFTTALAGPWAAGILAEQGADVIKIEQPRTGDIGRRVGGQHNGVSALFHMANRGKRSIALDLRQVEGRRIALDLAAGSDVVLQNFRPGVADRLGVGYEQIRDRRSDIVFVAVNGYGSFGPYARRPAYDGQIQAIAGMCEWEDVDDASVPRFVEQIVADKAASMATAEAVVAGLLARERGGGGQYVEVPMLDVAIAFMWMDSAGREILLEAPPELGSKASQARRCLQFVDGWAIVSISKAADVAGVCAALGLEPGAWTSVFAAGGRSPDPRELDAFVRTAADAARALPLTEGIERLEREDVPVGVVHRVADVHRDPHVEAVGLFEETAHPAAGRIREPRPPVRFGGTLAPVPGTSPALGEHSAQILQELGRADVDELRRRGVVV